jgi:ABC-2 type transport system permease protein
VTRHFRLIPLFWSTAIAAEMEYRLNFVISTLTALGGLAGSVFGLFLFYRTGYKLGGWTWEQAMLVMGLFTLMEGVAAAFLNPNLGRIVRHVQTGTLDFVLLKPIDSQFWLSTRNFSPWGLPDVLFGLIVIGYAGTRLGFGPLQYARGLVPLALGMAVLYSLWFLLGTTSIWFVKIYNVTEVLRSLLEAGRFPLSAYPMAYQFFFTFVVPVAFLTTVPAQAMIGRTGAGWMIGAGGVAVGLLLFSRWFWRFALRYYTSASS